MCVCVFGCATMGMDVYVGTCGYLHGHVCCVGGGGEGERFSLASVRRDLE